jgi:trigger factor
VKSAVETLNPTRVRLTVEVGFDELKPSLDAAYKKISGSVVLPGFRKGKVPARLIDQRFGREVVLEEAVNDALPKFYSEAVRENDVQALGQPEVDITEFADGAQLRFTAEVDVRPAIDLPDLSELSIVVADADVDDAEVDEQIQSLRERFGVLRGVDRPAQDGDFLSIDLAASVGGEVLEDASATGMSYQIGSGALLDGLDEAVIGRSAGESATFTTVLVGGERAGEEAEVTVTVNSVKERELPELDDEFAMTASEFDTLGELRDDLRNRLEHMKKVQQGVEARDKIIETLLEKIEVPLPESLVASEVEYRHDSLREQLEQAGLTKEQYLQAEDQSEDQFDGDVTERARMSIATQFLLDAIAAKEQVGLNEGDLTEHILRRAQRSGMSPDQFASELVQSNQVPLLMGEVLRGKALAVVLEAATVTDTSGRPVDLEALREDADEDIDQVQTIEYVGEPDEAAAEPGTAEPGTAESGTAEPASAESGTVGNSAETADPAHSPTA